MGNCLKTQLKENVQNDNLSYFNAVRMSFKGIGSSGFISCGFVSVSSGLNVKILSSNGNVYLSNQESSTNYGTEHTYNNESYVFIRGDVTSDWIELLLSTKDKVTGLLPGNTRIVKVNFNELSYCENLTSLIIQDGYFSGSLKSLESTSITDIRLMTDFCEASIEDMANLTSLTKLYATYKINGDISSISRLNLVELFLGNTLTTGDWKSYVEGRRINEQSGSMLMRSSVYSTFNGKQFSTWNNSTLVWDASSIIIKGLEDHTAYTYNITAAQRTALENEGYTTIYSVD